MSKKKFFHKLYKFHEKSKTYLIEVSLDDYDEIYDDWDPSPFKKRDIEPEFNDFIVNSSEDIPLNFKIGIVLYLPSSKKDEKKEATLISAYQNYYDYVIEKLNRSKSTLNGKIIFNLLFSMSLLFIGYGSSGDDGNIFINVFKEGIFIGGWVFLWDFFTTIFFTKRELRNQYKLYKRLYNADINFIYLD
ncbi:MAG TPA: hypothetical protein DEP72_03240 [Clostridiales bacterium]|nr:MAG: hypothetical protein A2Y18_08630 [Clostridiales bacterium GWD2_32_19]HCC07167.1 hypothetical protein [Clostridiales bacterium]